MQRCCAVTECISFTRVDITDHEPPPRVNGRVAMIGWDIGEFLQTGTVIASLDVHPAIAVGIEVHKHMLTIRVPVWVVATLVGPFGCRNRHPDVVPFAGHGD